MTNHDHDLARKFCQDLPQDGYCNGHPGWNADSLVKAYLAGLAKGREEQKPAKKKKDEE